MRGCQRTNSKPWNPSSQRKPRGKKLRDGTPLNKAASGRRSSSSLSGSVRASKRPLKCPRPPKRPATAAPAASRCSGLSNGALAGKASANRSLKSCEAFAAKESTVSSNAEASSSFDSSSPNTTCTSTRGRAVGRSSNCAAHQLAGPPGSLSGSRAGEAFGGWSFCSRGSLRFRCLRRFSAAFHTPEVACSVLSCCLLAGICAATRRQF
mmetsp:Transcript_40605/g.117239  ORF Transcript_40605/g.117239 Transcript_40605/m.117239 type:complete len:209 (-) Transcript_40605:521-1147(-)